MRADARVGKAMRQGNIGLDRLEDTVGIGAMGHGQRRGENGVVDIVLAAQPGIDAEIGNGVGQIVGNGGQKARRGQPVALCQGWVAACGPKARSGRGSRSSSRSLSAK